MHFTPLIYDNLDYAWSFSAELSPEGLIGIAGSVLRYAFIEVLLSLSNFLLSGRIFQVPKLGTKLKQDSIPLSYTPRKFITHPGNHYFYMIEGDHRVLGEVAAEAKLQELVHNQLINYIFSLSFFFQNRLGKKIDTEVVNLPAEIFGRPKAAAGTWGSSIRIIDPIEAKTVSVVHLEDNEAAFSLAVVPFSARGGELHLVVGTAADTLLSPRSCSTGYLRTYKFTDGGAGLEFQHKVCSFFSLPL
jgi:splicing factor 3B subunit 3